MKLKIDKGTTVEQQQYNEMKEGGMRKEERKENLDEMEGTSSRRQKKTMR